MGWLRRLFGSDTIPATEVPAEDRRPDPVTTGQESERGYYDGDPPVPAIIAIPHSRTYEGNDDGEPIDVTGYNLRTDDGRVLYAGRCGITRWGHLGIYIPDFVGESHVPQQDLQQIRLGAPAKLVPEPTNEYDPNAIRIETSDGTKVGYIAAKGTNSMRRAFRQLEAGSVHCAFFERHALRSSGGVVSAKIILWRPGALSGLDTPEHGPLE